MKSRTLIRRYTQGLINSAKDKAEFQSLCAELNAFDDTLSSNAKLGETLVSPLLPTSKREEIARLILDRSSLGDKVKRFILLLVENNRLTLLPEIREQLPHLWNEEHGIVTFEVSSVIPLSPSQKDRLEEKLNSLEKRSITLEYRIDPSLIGGLSIRTGNIVYDVSIQGDLERLKQKIVEE
jgi:F-type H+-transporting ATPase subunit delta